MNKPWRPGTASAHTAQCARGAPQENFASLPAKIPAGAFCFAAFLWTVFGISSNCFLAFWGFFCGISPAFGLRHFPGQAPGKGNPWFSIGKWGNRNVIPNLRRKRGLPAFGLASGVFGADPLQRDRPPQ